MNLATLFAGGAAALLLAGCASFDGHGLAAGTSSAEVQATMGTPAARVEKSDGSSVLYYPRLPLGRRSYAVTLGPDGRMRGIEQLLTPGNFNRLKVGEMDTREVRELLGPPDPGSVSHLPRQQREVWEYPWLENYDRRIFVVQFSSDGILREVINLRDDYHESPGAMP